MWGFSLSKKLLLLLRLQRGKNRPAEPLANVLYSTPQVFECDFSAVYFVWCRAIRPCLSFIFPMRHPVSFHHRLLPSFYSASCLAPHSFVVFPLFSLNLFAPSLSTPSPLLWSDQKPNLIKSIFPAAFSQECFLTYCLAIRCENQFEF